MHRSHTVFYAKTFKKGKKGWNWKGIHKAVKERSDYYIKREEDEKKLKSFSANADKVLESVGLTKYSRGVKVLDSSVELYAIVSLEQLPKMVEAMKALGIKFER